ncbi:MAG: alginate lyase, partial [Alphaproteobacteria bacterium]
MTARARGVVVFWLAITAPAALAADGYGPATFDVEARRVELAQPAFALVRDACLAADIDDALPVPGPVAGLQATSEYGSDQSAEDFAWSVMVLSGRSLAGDDGATRALIAGLAGWAEAGALEDTPTDYDPFYAMKRMLLPTMVGFRIVAAEMDAGQRATVEAWIDGLVRRLDTEFGGDVDLNNHRYLADLVLMTWGSIVRDRDLLAKG